METPKLQHQIEHAAQTILDGGVVCFPTESTYGLAVLASNHESLERLAEIKGRKDTSPFGLIVPSIESAVDLVERWSPKAQELAKKHWPGPLTLILKAKPGLHSRLLGAGGGVGFRDTSSSIAKELVLRVGGPITATSANFTGSPNATTVAEAKEQLGDHVDFYLDGGTCNEEPSTVVFIAGNEVNVLRKGPVVV